MKKLVLLLLPLALFAQPHSPNFVLSRETLSSAASRDSVEDYRLYSTVGQLSDAGIASSSNFVVQAGFLTPVYVPFQPVMVIGRDTVDYGHVWVNTAVEESIVVQNIGNADLIVDSVHSGHPLFQSITASQRIPAGQELVVALPLSAPDTLTYSGYLTAYSNAGQDSVFLTVNGVWSELEVNPEFIDFGSFAVGDSLDTLLTLRSLGNTAVVVTGLQFTNNHFIVFGPPLDTIEAHEDRALGVRFHALSSGMFLDTLVITSNVSEPVRIPLSAGVTSAADAALIPKEFTLDQNYPNPFNPSTSIRFGLPQSADVELSIFDVLGRHVIDLARSRFDPGYHVVTWNCAECPAGLYFLRMQSGDYVATKKLLMLK